MLRQLSAVWRARRVLLIGGREDAAATLEAWLTVLGARCQSLPPDADAETLNRTLTAGRIFAVIVCHPPASGTLLTEIREAGVPLTMICKSGDAQDAALRALCFGVRFTEENLSGGVYDLNEFS